MRSAIVVTYVGLGSGHGADLTTSATAALREARVIFARGAALEAARAHAGEQSDCVQLAHIEARAVEELLRAARSASAGSGGVVRAFLGASVHHARFWRELEQLRAAGVRVRVLPGLSAATERARARVLALAPLAGRCVAITRAEDQASAFAERLRDAGATVLALPAISMIEPQVNADYAARALAAGEYAWVVFTSQNGVRYFARALARCGLDARAFGSARVATIGPETTRALQALGLRADLCPREFVAESLVTELLGAMNEGGTARGTAVLLPRATVARDVLPRELQAHGARVDVVPVYETVDPPASVLDPARARLAHTHVDAVAFTSSSTVERFLKLYGRDVFSRGAVVATIGPITSATAQAAGLSVAVEAPVYTTAGLIDALCELFAGAASAAVKSPARGTGARRGKASKASRA